MDDVYINFSTKIFEVPDLFSVYYFLNIFFTEGGFFHIRVANKECEVKI
jgi:hypothetical protein